MTRSPDDYALDLYAESPVPTEYGLFRVMVFRERPCGGDSTCAPVEHVAIVCGDVAGRESVLARAHSECWTGEALHSLKCDCREQLDLALRRIAVEGRGVVLYLRQEGRGIGLGNKIRAYALQSQGHDTVDANRLLGFADDLRSYRPAAEMLRALGVRSVVLLTNNPAKVAGLEAEGARVERREPVSVAVNAHSRGYLRAKQDRMGHDLPEGMLERDDTPKLARTLEPEAMDSAAEALAYDRMDHSAVNRRFVDDLIALAPGVKRVLDLGAGTGLIPIELCTRGPGVTVTAVDLAPAMLRRAAQNVAAAGVTSRVGLVVCDVAALPYAPESYDAVVSNSLVHHVPDPLTVFRAVAAAAGARSAVLVRDLCRPERASDVDALVERYAGGEEELARSLFRASLHAALTVDEVREAAVAAGLHDASVVRTTDRHWTLSRPAR